VIDACPEPIDAAQTVRDVVNNSVCRGMSIRSRQ
jgi:hypothetical protein